MIDQFQHQMAAHCENGVISNLLRHYGLDLSEPMIFGIGSGIYFSHLTMFKLNGAPVTSFRPLPGVIFKRAAKSLDIKMHIQRFPSQQNKAMEVLDQNIAKNIPTGVVVGVFNLPYFPAAYRFHFNAHNIIVFKKQEDNYFVSDPVMEEVVSLSREDLIKVRYAQGTYKPKGKMYYIKNMPSEPDLNTAIRRGIKKTIFEMVKVPGPIIGTTGMRFLSRQIAKYPDKLGERKAGKYLGQIVRMQEEIGTGGAGFRFLYAAFLQEASQRLNMPSLNECSEMMTKVGDRWRDFAVQAGRLCKGRQDEESYESISQLLYEIAGEEEQIYRNLDKIIS